MFLPEPTLLCQCLTCGGTGRRGNLSGKKKCKFCGGTGTRSIVVSPPTGTVVDFAQVTVPPVFYSRIERDTLTREYLCVPPPVDIDDCIQKG